MKLKNKRSGEIKEFVLFDGKNELQGGATLKDLVKEWEDYEEPENFYIVEQRGTVGSRFRTGDEYEKMFKEIGNYFDSREEAEKAVEKLKAWKRLKDKGLEFCCDIKYESLCGNGFNIPLNAIMPPEAYTDTEVSKDLDLLFGGEE